MASAFLDRGFAKGPMALHFCFESRRITFMLRISTQKYRTPNYTVRNNLRRACRGCKMITHVVALRPRYAIILIHDVLVQKRLNTFLGRILKGNFYSSQIIEILIPLHLYPVNIADVKNDRFLEEFCAFWLFRCKNATSADSKIAKEPISKILLRL